MPWELPYLHYDLESLRGMLEWSSDQRVQSPKRSRSYLWRRSRSWSNLWRGCQMRGQSGGSVRWGVRVEGVCSNVGDCWKGLRIRSTPKCLQNLEAVGVWRMLKVSVMTCSFLANNHLVSPLPYSPLLGALLFRPIHWSNLYQSRSLIPLTASPPKVPLNPPNTPATSKTYL